MPVIVPHGLALHQFSAAPRRYEGNVQLTFAYCGGLARHKGVHVLLDAFRALPHSNIKLHIHGQASANERQYENELRKIADSDPRIRLCGPYQEADAGAVFAAIDVLVIPSLWPETYSFVLHEAFASNVPVIASDIGNLSESIDDSDTGWKFKPGDETGLRSRLAHIAENPGILTQVRINLERCMPPLQEEEAYLYERLYQLAGAKTQAEASCANAAPIGPAQL